jgi:hypothetical protein
VSREELGDPVAFRRRTLATAEDAGAAREMLQAVEECAGGWTSIDEPRARPSMGLTLARTLSQT